MARARGSGLNALFKEESSYGVQPTGNWRQIQLFDHDVGEEQPLIESNILGQGREAQKPLQDIKTDEGGMNVPVDLRNFGFWLKMLLGAPTTTQIAATGTIVFPVNPSASDTITINGVVFTYVAASPTGNEILIGASLLDTLNNTQIALDASADMNVDDATYTDDNIDTLTITHDTPGPTGNLFTLAASAATVSAATLLGGAERHQFISGVTSLPSFAMEFGHPEVPQYLAHFGGRLNSMALNFQRSGAAQAALDLMFQKEKKFITSQGGTPTTLNFNPFNQFQGSIKRNSVVLGNITGASFTYSNQFERIETIRNDALPDGIDEGLIKITGSIESRFADSTLFDDATNFNPIEVEMGYTINTGERLLWTFHEVLLPKPKIPTPGPGGISATFNWQGALDEGLSKSVTVDLYNDVANYDA